MKPNVDVTIHEIDLEDVIDEEIFDRVTPVRRISWANGLPVFEAATEEGSGATGVRAAARVKPPRPPTPEIELDISGLDQPDFVDDLVTMVWERIDNGEYTVDLTQAKKFTDKEKLFAHLWMGVELEKLK